MRLLSSAAGLLVLAAIFAIGASSRAAAPAAVDAPAAEGRAAARPGPSFPAVCLPGPASCIEVLQPPDSCTSSSDCPLGYTCEEGACTGGACVVKADCPADGQCFHIGSSPDGTCVCRGCGPWDCLLGCGGFIQRGCICEDDVEDCPPEDDVCFMGICS